MSIFQYDSYKQFVTEKAKRGDYQKMAMALRVHATLISQVFRGVRELTPEQASELASYLNLNDAESDYFLCLVELSRAGNQPFRRIVEKRIERLKKTPPIF